MPKPHAHLKTMTKGLQSFKLIGIKLYKGLCTQGTNPLSSNTQVEKGGITPQGEPQWKTKKNNKKNTGPLIPDIKIQDPSSSHS